MKTYLIAINRNDTEETYPYECKARSLNMALALAVARSLKYKPAEGKAAFCMVNAYELSARDDSELKYDDWGCIRD